MIGIGLGGFMDGFEKGRDIRNNNEDRARQKVMQGRQDDEFKRLKGQRDQIDQINSDAKATFDTRVAAGEAKPDDFENFYNNYAIPKLQQTYLSQGDLQSAKEVKAWGDTADAQRGAKLFSSALLKAQTGDSTGALTDVMEMGKISGYLDHGYEVLGSEDIVVDGSLTGHRIKMRTPDGKDLIQDIVPGDLPKLIATFSNPQAAWESQVAAKAAAGKKAEELETYKAKKQIDQAYGTNSGGDRKGAIEALRKRMDGGIGDDEPKFDDLEPEEQEALIQKEIELVSGQPGLGGNGAGGGRPDPQPIQPKVVMDKATGQPVALPDERAPAAAPAPAAPAKREPTPAEQKQRQQNVTEEVEGAAVALQDGVRPEQVKERLMQQGIPEDQWPEQLRRAQPAASKSDRGSARDVSEKTGRGGQEAEIIRQAAAEIAKGGETEWIIADLRRQGIPEERWPAELRGKGRRADTQIGLGQ